MNAFAPHAIEAEATPDPERDRWRRAGFRLVAIPVALAETTEPSLPHADAVRRIDLGQPTRWSPLATKRLPEGTMMRVPGGPQRFTAGRLELLTRAWPEPTVRNEPSFRVELAVGWSPATQHPPRRRLLAGLTSSLSIPQGMALAVLPARPEEEWTEAITKEHTESDTTPGVGPGPADGEHAAHSGLAPLLPPGLTALTAEAGPEPGPEPHPFESVGEALLIAPAVMGDRPVPARREVFVLIPRWP